MHNIIVTFRHLSLWLALSLFTCPAFAGGQVAEVGVYQTDGRIKLHIQRFQTQFPDGAPISELKLKISNGFVHLFRKGYSAEDACRTELIEVVDAEGFPVKPGAFHPPGTPVFIQSLSSTILRLCEDTGCHALKNVVPIGEPPLQRASCDRTELSENKCACHVNEGGGDRIVSGNFCYDRLSQIIKPPVHWVKLMYIENL